MGVLGLTPFLQKKCPQVINKLPQRLKSLSGKTIVIDATLITQRLHFAPAPHPYRHVLGWYRLANELRENNVNVICVFDGKERSAAKARETERRAAIRRIALARGSFEGGRWKRLQRLTQLLDVYESMNSKEHVQVAKFLRKVSTDPLPVSPIPDGIPSDLWLPVPEFAAETYARFSEQKDDFCVVPDLDIPHVREQESSVESSSTEIDPVQTTSPDLCWEEQEYAFNSQTQLSSKTPSINTQSSSDPIPPPTPEPSQTLKLTKLDEDGTYTNLVVPPLHASLVPLPEKEVDIPETDALSEKDVQPPEKDVPLPEQDLLLPQKDVPPPGAVPDPVPDTQLLEHVAIAPHSLDAIVPAGPYEEHVDEKEQKSLPEALGSLYMEYRQSTTASTTIFEPQISDSTSPFESLEEAEGKRAEIVMTRNQANLTREEGEIWEDLTYPDVERQNERPSFTLRDLASRSENIVVSYDRRTAKPTFQTYEECKEILRAMSIPVIEAVGAYEGEAVASAMVHAGFADYVGSEDTDVLLYNAPMIRGLGTRREKIIALDPSTIWNGLGLLSHSQFIEFCLLLGTDFSSRIKNIGPARALKYIKEFQTVDNLLEVLDKLPTKRVFDLKMQKELYMHEVQIARAVYYTIPPLPDDFEDQLRTQGACLVASDGEGSTTRLSLSPPSKGAVQAVMRRYGLQWVLRQEESRENADEDEWSIQDRAFRRQDLESGVYSGILGLHEGDLEAGTSGT